MKCTYGWIQEKIKKMKKACKLCKLTDEYDKDGIDLLNLSKNSRHEGYLDSWDKMLKPEDARGFSPRFH